MIALLIAFATHWLVTHLAAGLGGWLLHIAWRRLIVPRLLALLPSIGSTLIRSLLSRIL